MAKVDVRQLAKEAERERESESEKKECAYAGVRVLTSSSLTGTVG